MAPIRGQVKSLRALAYLSIKLRCCAGRFYQLYKSVTLLIYQGKGTETEIPQLASGWHDVTESFLADSYPFLGLSPNVCPDTALGCLFLENSVLHNHLPLLERSEKTCPVLPSNGACSCQSTIPHWMLQGLQALSTQSTSQERVKRVCLQVPSH